MSSSNRPLVISHKNCWDGAFAAYCALKRYPNAEVHFAQYNEPIKFDYTDREVYILDFTFPIEILKDMILKARSVVLLDHHPEAENVVESVKAFIDDIRGGDNGTFKNDPGVNAIFIYHVFPNTTTMVFDKNMSGAELAWEFFHPETPTPDYIRYVSDYDRWKFELEDTKAFMGGIGQYPISAEVYLKIFKDPGIVKKLIAEGTIINRYRTSVVEGIIKMTKRFVRVEMPQEAVEAGFLKEYIVPVANAPKMFVSEVGHELSKGYAFSMVYYDGHRGRAYRLTSQPGTVDVNLLARYFGGGGHEHASGVVHNKCIDLFPQVDSDVYPPTELFKNWSP